MDVKVFNCILSKMEKSSSELLNHSERTAILCYAAAKELELDANYLEIAYMAGLLHDVGKINLPSILKLKEQNIEIDKIYPYFSAAIVNCFDDCEEVADVIIQCNENIDGSGYPNGLQNEEIGLIARILRIADYYDDCRMKGLTHDETTKQIRENTDIIFPKKIITPFIKSIIKNELQFDYED